MITMESLIIKCREYIIFVYDPIYKKLYDIFPNFKDLVDKDNILDLKCYKLTNYDLYNCILLIIEMIEVFDNIRTIKLNADEYYTIKNIVNRHNNICNNIHCKMLILLEYFVAEISSDIIFGLYSLCSLEDTDVINYIKDKSKDIISKDKYYKVLFIYILRKFLVREIVNKSDSILTDRLNDDFIKCVEYDDTGDIIYVHYPKDTNSKIEKVICDWQLDIHYKYKFIAVKSDKIWDDFYSYSLYTINGEYKFNMASIVEGVKIKIGGGVVLFEDKRNISIISEEELYRMVSNPTLKEVTHMFYVIVSCSLQK